MRIGIDTTFLVEVEIVDHPQHQGARGLLDQLLDDGHVLALAPQVIAEFIHVVTDARRFEHPLDMEGALGRARAWWNAREVVQVLPDAEAMLRYWRWMSDHKLGRKRILDTMLAATWYGNDVRSVVTGNVRDYRVFGCFEVLGAG